MLTNMHACLQTCMLACRHARLLNMYAYLLVGLYACFLMHVVGSELLTMAVQMAMSRSTAQTPMPRWMGLWPSMVLRKMLSLRRWWLVWRQLPLNQPRWWQPSRTLWVKALSRERPCLSLSGAHLPAQISTQCCTVRHLPHVVRLPVGLGSRVRLTAGCVRLAR